MRPDALVVLSCFVAFALAGCEARSRPPSGPDAVSPQAVSRLAAQPLVDSEAYAERPFFPPEEPDVAELLRAARAAFERHRRGWYSPHQEAAGEPSLVEAARDDPRREAYRFSWLRSFHAPVFVRVEMSRDGTAVVIATVLTGAGGYQPGEIRTSAVTKLSRRRTDEFRAALRKADFWAMPEDGPPEVGLDGSEWKIEGIAGGRHHVVDRWCGQPDLVELGRAFLRMGGLEDVEPVY